MIENYEPAIARLKDAEISGERTPMITAELARSLIGNGQAEAALELLDGAPIDNERHLATVNRLKIAAQQIMKKAD